MLYKKSSGVSMILLIIPSSLNNIALEFYLTREWLIWYKLKWLSVCPLRRVSVDFGLLRRGICVVSR